jgi:hypothetical protein
MLIRPLCLLYVIGLSVEVWPVLQVGHIWQRTEQQPSCYCINGSLQSIHLLQDHVKVLGHVLVPDTIALTGHLHHNWIVREVSCDIFKHLRQTISILMEKLAYAQ